MGHSPATTSTTHMALHKADLCPATTTENMANTINKNKHGDDDDEQDDSGDDGRDGEGSLMVKNNAGWLGWTAGGHQEYMGAGKGRTGIRLCDPHDTCRCPPPSPTLDSPTPLSSPMHPKFIHLPFFEWEIMNLWFLSLPDAVIAAHPFSILTSAAIFSMASSPSFPTTGSAAWSSILLDDPISTVKQPSTPPAVFSTFHQ
ncbi:hypothetical protein ARMSODRAFT_972883 [Armillaria solidipes]|uniref:Uncharacterized protein n=1 Tax=Armillaria solidipes TaxID=1076256 RepID=A0A2H3BMW9_9AGAR|nr:hypothetical protein ARMSODRAFT_972883 [Armillaria solidipes]